MGLEDQEDLILGGEQAVLDVASDVQVGNSSILVPNLDNNSLNPTPNIQVPTAPTPKTPVDITSGTTPRLYATRQIVQDLIRDGFLPDAAHGFRDQWRYNFEIIRGPLSTAFNDATLTYQDIAWGYRLEYNPNGILWRVNAAGIPHPDDYNNYFEQNRIIEEATNKTVADIPGGNIAVSSNGDGNTTSQDNANVQEQTETNNEGGYLLIAAKSIGLGTAMNAAFSNAVYYDGSQKIPDGWRSIGKRWNEKTDYYAEYFTDGKQIIVAFRGTPGIFSKAFAQSDIQLIREKVVAQFADVEETKKQLENIIANDRTLQGLPISATGHSLGGACAQYFTLISGYQSETFGAPGVGGSLGSMKDYLKEKFDIDINTIDKQTLPIINRVNMYDPVGTAELGGHLGTVIKYDMHPAYLYPNPTSEWITDNWLVEHSMDTYQSYLGNAPERYVKPRPSTPSFIIDTTLP